MNEITIALISALATGSLPLAGMKERVRPLVEQLRPGFLRDTGERLTEIDIATMEGRLDDARRLCDEGIKRGDEMGNSNLREACIAQRAAVERVAGDAAAVAAAARQWHDGRAAAGSVGEASTAAAILAEALAQLREVDEASVLAKRAFETSEERDFATRCVALRASARIESERGNHADALSLTRRALALCDRAQWPQEVGLTYLAASEIMTSAGRPADAAEAARRAFEKFDTKGIEPLAAQAKRLLNQHGSEAEVPRGEDLSGA